MWHKTPSRRVALPGYRSFLSGLRRALGLGGGGALPDCVSGVGGGSPAGAVSTTICRFVYAAFGRTSQEHGLLPYPAFSLLKYDD